MASTPPIAVRAAGNNDLQAVARVWAEGWRDAHEQWVSPELMVLRTEASFRPRARARIQSTLVAVDGLSVLGFVIVVHDEVEQMYVDRESRGSGVAAQLLAAAERVVAARGFEQTWLAVIPENIRARRFYERRGWVDQGAFSYEAEGDSGPIHVLCRRYVKALSVQG